MSKWISSVFRSALLAIAGTLLFSAASVDAATIGTADTVVVLRVGEGSTALAATAARVYLEEYAITFDGTGVPTGATHVQTIPVNHTAAPNPFGTKLTIAGTASVEGGMNFSTDGQYLMFGGYHAEVAETTSGKQKVVGRIDLAGNVTFDGVYGAGTTAANNAMRTVASSDGSQYWFGMSASPGIAYRTWEGPPGDDGDDSTVTAVSLNALNTRRLEIYNGQLYVGSASGTNHGVSTVGSGTPTATGQTVTILPGMPTAAGPSPYDFWFADPNTLYVADDRTNANGGLQKWILSSGTWSLAYTKNIDTTNNTLDNGMRGLTGSVGTDGTVTLFGTTTFSGTVTNFLVGISDTLINTNPANVTVNSLASSASIPGAGGALTNFRGLEDIGVFIPEPASLVLLAVGGMFVLSARRRQARST